MLFRSDEPPCSGDGGSSVRSDGPQNAGSGIPRFEARQIGPTNLRAVATDEVQANYAIAAVIAQSEYSVIQKAGGKYWDPVQSFGEIIAQGALDRNDPAAIQTSLDALVEGVTAAIE